MLYTEERLISVVLKRRGGRVKVRGCLVLMVEDTSSFGKAVIRELLVLVCLLLRDGLTEESIFIGSDMNGHVGRDADGYGGVHGGMGFGTRNSEGERIL